MDEKEFKARAKRLAEIADVLEKLPTEIRSGAFDLLREYVTGDDESSATPTAKHPHKVHKGSTTDNADEAKFFGAFEHTTPAANARLLAAYFYAKFGLEPFSLDEIRAKGAAVGITIPERVDMTFAQATAKGKKLFTSAGHGKLKPTVHGEAYLKEKYGVKMGTKKREPEGNK
jgi:hypothetical protein